MPTTTTATVTVELLELPDGVTVELVTVTLVELADGMTVELLELSDGIITTVVGTENLPGPTIVTAWTCMDSELLNLI